MLHPGGGDQGAGILCGGPVGLGEVTFCGGTVHFDGSTFAGGEVNFYEVTYSGGTVQISGAGGLGRHGRLDGRSARARSARGRWASRGPSVRGRRHGFSPSAALLSGSDETCAGNELCAGVALTQGMDHALQDPERARLFGLGHAGQHSDLDGPDRCARLLKAL